ncbi:MAG: polysaccharide biosynthesis/export family protein [Geminicoccaceae bacterium]|nr:polysaccharide export protein [Geminicoccaceae bacterium]MCB9942161.1 polysaccharide biosynthesis/export family protein [Geminicoccaceae bacterium]
MKNAARTSASHSNPSPCSRFRRLRWSSAIVALAVAAAVSGCQRLPEAPLNVSPTNVDAVSGEYSIAPGDKLQVFVWQDRDLSLTVRVRPDGRISMPLINEIAAAGKTPPQLANDIKRQLSTYVQDPVVTVIVADYEGPLDQQVRVIGEATKPQSLTYQPDMSLLDALIAVEGLTDYADGNAAVLVRKTKTGTERYRVRLNDLLQDGDVSANAKLLPGDVLIIPETSF